MYLNCRFGDLNNIHTDNNRLLYEDNADESSNKHGLTYGYDLCRTGNMFPLNHLIYRTKSFDGDYTYFKGNKKSQIDFVYTNKDGLKLVKEFVIHKDDWHLSDHRSVSVEINANRMFNSVFLLKRAKELNYEFDPHRAKIVRHLGTYDMKALTNYLTENDTRLQGDVLSEINRLDINKAVIKLNNHLHDALRVAKKKKIVNINNASKTAMERANLEFENYQKSLKGESIDSSSDALKKYQSARNNVSSSMHKTEHSKWTKLIQNKNSKDLWNSIDWNGNLSKCETVQPTDDELALHFEKLYSSDDPNETSKIEELSTDNYVRALDDPLTMEELDAAAKEMKKVGLTIILMC